MRRIGARTRTGLVIVLGVLAGFGFISLPSVLTTLPHSQPSQPSGNTTRTTPTNSTSDTVTTTSFGAGTPTLHINQTTTPQNTHVPPTLSLTALGTIVSLLVIPAFAISFVASTLVSRRKPRAKTADSNPEE